LALPVGALRGVRTPLLSVRPQLPPRIYQVPPPPPPPPLPAEFARHPPEVIACVHFLRFLR
jgi:hypothetical protein